jgi:hypothetical protein
LKDEFAMTEEQSLPYGTLDLDPDVHVAVGAPDRVQCYVRGCRQLLRPAKQLCPVHGIYCHKSRHGTTYSYSDARRNIIVSPELLGDRVVGHPFKYESSRLGLENSEDALTWNVFRSLQQAGCLWQVAKLITGEEQAEEPALYLWGLCLTGDTLEPWDSLLAARERFESNLPVTRPPTEPDIGLHLPGRYLILIEAKFTSPNQAYVTGPRRDATSLTKAELLDIYRDPCVNILNIDKAKGVSKVYYQLWRNMVFAEWMALTDNRKTSAVLANLTRAGYEADSCGHFRSLIREGFEDRFVHFAWEDIYNRVVLPRPELSRLRRYLETKTTGLLPAFRISTARET